MKKIVFFTLCFLMSGVTVAATLEAHIRHRPPDLVVQGGKFDGPLKEVMDVAAQRAGHTVNWSDAPFKRSIEDLKTGSLDLLPRTFLREDRKVFAHFLDPVGFQEKSVVFFVKKGSEGLVKSYEDLSKVSVGIKRGTVYFKKFDEDESLNKVVNTDDAGLTKMLQGGRIDVMAAIDTVAAVEHFKNNGFEYSQAEYSFYKKTGVYYASSKKRYESGMKAAYDSINAEVKKMVASGEVDKIYTKHGVTAPSH